jgi:hypothetical protein
MEQEQPVIRQPSVFWKIVRRFFLWTTISFIALAITVVALAYAYEDDAKKAVIDELNKHLNAEIKIEPQNIDFTIIRTFPNAAVEFKNAMAYEALKKEKRDTLFTAGLISMQFNVLDIFNGNYKVKKIKIRDALLNLKVDKQGRENYIFWKPDTSNAENEKGVSFRVEDISLEAIKVKYRNRQSLVKVIALVNKAHVSGAFAESRYGLKSEGSIAVEILEMEKRALLSKKDLKYSFDIDVDGSTYTFRNADISINRLSFTTSGSMVRTDSALVSDLNIKGKNIDVRSTLSLLPKVEQERLKDYESEGLFYVDGKIKGDLKKFSSLFVQAEFGIQNATITYLPDGTRLEKVNLNGKYIRDNEHPEKLELKNISTRLKNEDITGNFMLTDFNDPYIELEAKGAAQLGDLHRFYPIDTISEISGGVKFDVYLNGSLSQLKNNFAEHNEKSRGAAEFTSVSLKFKHDEKELLIPSGKLSLSGSDVLAENINVKLGKSDAVLNGNLQNFIGWLMREGQDLKVNAKLESGFISLDELLESPGNSVSDRPYELEVSEHINLDLDVHIGKAMLGKFTANTLAGKLRIKDKKIFTENMSFETMDGDVTITGMIDASKENNIEISGSCKLITIDINKLFYQLNNFGQEAIQDKHLRGIATASIDFSTKWSKALVYDPKAIIASCDLTIERGELVGYKSLESLSKYVELKELQDIKFSTLQSHIEIKDEVINISRTSIKNSAMNLDFYGKHTFNNEIDYHIKLLLSEVMAKRPGKNRQLDEELALVENDPENKRSVFLTMTGTLDNPIIKYDKKGMKEKIKEDIKEEKKNLKKILFEEFGLFKKDTLHFKNKEEQKKSDQKFQVEFGDKRKDKEEKQKEKPSDLKGKPGKDQDGEEDDF